MPTDSFPPAAIPLGATLQQTLWLLGLTERSAEVAPATLGAFVRHHGVAGLLQASRIATCPPLHRQVLAKEQQQLAIRALQLSTTLKRVLTAMAAQQVHPLVLKGPAIALQAHGTPAARGGIDLDLLLDEAQWPTALQILAQQGYTPAANQVLPLPAGTHELVLHHEGHSPPIELHRRLLRRRYGCEPKGYTQLELQSTPIRSLDPTHALPYLLIHANQHSFRRLIWLLDIHALLKHPDLDLEHAARLCIQIGAGGALDTCLALLGLLFGHVSTPVLQHARRRCKASHALTHLALLGIEGSLSDAELARRYGVLRRVVLDVTLQDRLPGRWQALCDWLSPTSTDIRWLRLPPSLTFLYPLLRLARLSTRPPRYPEKGRLE